MCLLGPLQWGSHELDCDVSWTADFLLRFMPGPSLGNHRLVSLLVLASHAHPFLEHTNQGTPVRRVHRG